VTVFAVILAGGSGSRLGQVRKADLRVGGRTLLQRVIDQLGLSHETLLVSTGRDGANGGFGIGLTDLDLPIGGPLAGLIAAASHIRETAQPDTILLSVAVDTPFLPDNFVPRLVDALSGGARAAQASWRGNIYPTNAAWRVSDLASLPERIGAGTAPRSAKALLAELGAVEVDWADACDVDPFANLNTMEDLIGLSRRARSSEE